MHKKTEAKAISFQALTYHLMSHIQVTGIQAKQQFPVLHVGAC